MTTNVDHWEQLFDSKYLRWFHLKGQPALVEIMDVEKDVEMTLPGGAKTKRPLIKLKQVNGKIETVKPLVLNKTNTASVAEIHGPKPKLWIGKEIVLFEDVTNCKGKQTQCIRIRKRK